MEEVTEVKIKLPSPHPKQKLVVNSKARFKVLCCGRRFGKSLIALVLSIKDMLFGKKVAYVTPEYGLAKDFFKEFILTIPEQLIKVANKSELYIELVTGGSIKFFSGEAIDNFRGRKFHKVIIDEAAFIPDLENAWTQSIRPTLTDYKGDAIFISTPKGKNYFDALFVKGKNGENGYESFHFSSYDNPYIDPTEIDEARATLPDAVFKQEYLAIPAENGANPFGSEHIKKNILKALSTQPAIVYGIDVAKYNDWTVIVGLDKNGNLCHFERFQAPWEKTKDRIKALPSNIVKVMDTSGVGDVIFEDISKTVQGLVGFKFTTESKPQLMYKLIKAVEVGDIKYNDVIANEMSVFEYKYTSTGHIKFEASAGYHDDTICALALANEKFKKAQNAASFKLY